MADSTQRQSSHVTFPTTFTPSRAKLLEKEGLDFGILGPLVLETAAKAVATDNPAAVQTGPAVRGDTVTMRRHEAILARENDERYNKIYKLLSESIWETSKKI